MIFFFREPATESFKNWLSSGGVISKVVTLFKYYSAVVD